MIVGAGAVANLEALRGLEVLSFSGSSSGLGLGLFPEAACNKAMALPAATRFTRGTGGAVTGVGSTLGSGSGVEGDACDCCLASAALAIATPSLAAKWQSCRPSWAKRLCLAANAGEPHLLKFRHRETPAKTCRCPVDAEALDPVTAKASIIGVPADLGRPDVVGNIFGTMKTPAKDGGVFTLPCMGRKRL